VRYTVGGLHTLPSTAPPRPLFFLGATYLPGDRRTAVGLVVDSSWRCLQGPIAIACLRQALAGQAREGLALGAQWPRRWISAMRCWPRLRRPRWSVALRGLVTDNAWYVLAFQGGCIVVLVVLGLRYCRLMAKIKRKEGGVARLSGDAGPTQSTETRRSRASCICSAWGRPATPCGPAVAQAKHNQHHDNPP